MKPTMASLIATIGATAAQDGWGTTSSLSASTAEYACNPAHSYPNGASCISTAGTLSLVTQTASATDSTSMTGYACNPAHSYPNGATCISTVGTLSLVTPAASSSPTFACNPAHSYPNGASCISTAGTLSLITPTTSISETYACNPAHSYPNGASCISTAGTLSLILPTASANQTYACNPAHSYPGRGSCILTSGTLSLVTPSAPAASNVTVTAVVTAYTTYCPNPTTFAHGNETYTVTKPTTLTISSCPGGCTITKPISEFPGDKTVTAIVSSFTTVCPSPTTLTYNQKTYTVEKSTTLTITHCPGGCTISRPASEIPPTPPKITVPANSSVIVPPPKYTFPANGTLLPPAVITTIVSSSFTTFCPNPTTLTFGTKTYPVTAPTMLTITDCKDGCTVTSQATKPTVPPGVATYDTQRPSGTVFLGTRTASATVSLYTGAAGKITTGGSFLAAMAAGAMMF